MNEIDEIRQEMARIRFNLHADLREVIHETGRMLDWRRQVRNAPWLWVGGALALGYFVIPRRSTPRVDAPAPAALPEPVPPAARASLLGSLGLTPGRLAGLAFRAAGPMLLATAQSYALPLIEQWMARSQAPGGAPDGPGMPAGHGLGGAPRHPSSRF